MADRDDASGNEFGPLGAAAPEPTLLEPAISSEGAPAVAAEPWTIPVAGTATSGYPAEPELPEDLLAVQAALEQPTGAMPAVPVAAATDDVAGQQSATAEQAAAEPEPEHALAEPPVAEDSLDDIAPGTVAAESQADGTTVEVAETDDDDVAPGTSAHAAPIADADEEPLFVPPRTKVSWWPFVAYIVVWLAVAGYAVWKLQQLPPRLPAYESDIYKMSIVVGLSLLAAGPALLIIVWFASWIGRKNVRVGAMFVSALVKGATATMLGALIWFGAIALTDYLRLGRPF
jgi:hypothetical protein